MHLIGIPQCVCLGTVHLHMKWRLYSCHFLCTSTANTLLEYKLSQKETVKLSIFLMPHMHKLWTMAACVFVGWSDSEWAILVAPWPASAVSAITLPLRAAFHLGPFTETFQKERKRTMERGRSRGRECRGKEKGSASAAPSSRLRSTLWISMPLMKKSADVERKYSTVCVCVWGRKQEQGVQLVELFCVCSLCNMSPAYLGLCDILTSACHINTIIKAWCYSGRKVLYSFNTVDYSIVLWCVTELAVEVCPCWAE